jgi:hypothetical protein
MAPPIIKMAGRKLVRSASGYEIGSLDARDISVNALTIILCWSVYPFSIETIPQYLIASFTLTLAIFAYYAWDEATRGTAALKEQAKTLQGQLDMRMRPEFLTQPASSSITLRIQVSTTSHPSDNP